MTGKKKWLSSKGLNTISGWARDGLTNKEISKRMGISESTFYDWQKNSPELSNTIKTAKEVADYQVEQSLYKLATGHFVTEEKITKIKKVYYDDNGKRCEDESVVVTPVKVYIPPNFMAIAMWLNNRQPGKWKRNANKENLDEKRLELEKEKAEKGDW